MAEEWLTVTELANRLGLAENTARRYAKLFDEYISSRKYGRTIKYDPEAIKVMDSVSRLYKEGLGTQEIQERLRGVYPLHVDVQQETDKDRLPATPTAIPEVVTELKEAIARMTEQMDRQEAFNKELLQHLQEREQYIDLSLRTRDEKLMDTLREIKEYRLQIAAAEQKKKSWWKWW